MHKAQRFLLTGLFLLTACGFSPIYGSHEGKGPVSEALSNVAIENIKDENGQYLRNKLIDRMYFHGRPQHPKATLSVSLKFSEVALGIQKDATASRSQLTLWANYVLRDQDGNELFKSKAHSVAFYNKIEAQYGQVATKRNTYERTLNEVAEQIVNGLSLYYAENDKAGSKN